MAYELHFDLGTLKTQAAKVRQIEENLTKSSQQLTSQLKTLKGEWQSDAGDAFFEKYDTSWMPYIEKYCSLLRDVADELDYAIQEYEPLVNEYNSIRL